ncbi:MAG: hypothetical protein IKD04_08265 [Clostridia bacterium]|nr:hypothetical protein [Clostridia bacterium]
MKRRFDFSKRILAVASAAVLLITSLAIQATATDTTKEINVRNAMFTKYVENRGTADENWTPAISAAINYAAENGYDTVYIPAGEYPCEASDEKETWELEPAAFNIPDAPLTIRGAGAGTVIYKPRASKTTNIVAMFRTSFKSTSEITLKDFKIRGTYNPGSNYGLADAIVINGSSNVTIENIYTEGTKRHGIYLICGAHNNLISNVYIDNPTRMMLGTGIQLEGAYNNEFYDVYLTNIGANGIDLNMWNAGSYYPANNGINGSPYEADEKYYSTGNVFIGGYISGTGLHNGRIGGGGYIDPSPYDDYYGINVINGSNNNKFVFDYIENVRMTETDYENAAAIRLMGSYNNTFEIGRVTNSSQYVVRCNNPNSGNKIVINEATGIAGDTVNLSEAGSVDGNYFVIGNEIFGGNLPKENVLRMAVKFSNGQAGVSKTVKYGLYSLDMIHTPSQLNLIQQYNKGSNKPTGGVPIKGNWSFKYDYMISDDIVGLGNIMLQENDTWGVAGDIATDHTDGLNIWQSESLDLSPWNCTESWGRAMHAVGLTVSTKDAVDTSKTYYAYYKNLRIEDENGKVVYTVFDSTVTTDQLCMQEWLPQTNQNATASFDVVPSPDTNTLNETKAIKAEFTFENGEAGVAKNIQKAIYGNYLKSAPSILDLEQEYYFNGELKTGKAPIKGNWVFKYEYMLDEALKGMGAITLQSYDVWQNVTGNTDKDLSAGVGKWQTAELDLSGWGCTEENAKGMYVVAISLITSEAVDATKTYSAYFKNLRVEDENGNIIYKLFTDSITTSQLEAWTWGTPSQGVSMDLSVVDIPYDIEKGDASNGSFEVKAAANKGDTIDVAVTPNVGYRVNRVMFGERAATKNARNSYSFSMPSTDVKVSVIFEPSVAGDIDESGSINSTDLVCLKSILLGNFFDYDVASADVKSDNLEINILDLIGLKKLIANNA